MKRRDKLYPLEEMAEYGIPLRDCDTQRSFQEKIGPDK